MTTQEPNPANPPSSATQTPSGSPEATSQTSAEATTDLGTEEPAAPAASAEPTTDLGEEEAPAAGDADAPKPWAEFHGAPVDDKGAPADFAVTAPDGMPMDEEMLKEFTPIARELNLSNKGAQKLIDLKAKDIKVQTRRWGEHLGELKQDAMKDAEIGGAQYAPTVAAGKAVLKKFGTPALSKALNTYGLGAHKEFIRFLGKVAKATGETATPPPGAGGGATQQRPLHDVLFKDTP